MISRKRERCNKLYFCATKRSRAFCLTPLVDPVVPASYQPVAPKYLCYSVSTARPRLQTSPHTGDPIAVELLHAGHSE